MIINQNPIVHNTHKNVCIFHSKDFDGYCSAAIVKKYHDENQLPLILIGFDYPDEDSFDWKIIDSNTSLIICDVSFSVPNFKLLIEHSKDVVWIDHHINKIKEIEEKL